MALHVGGKALKIITLFSISTMLLWGGTASAQSLKGVGFAGISYGRGISTYAGVTHSLPGGTLGNGLAIRVAGSAGTFSYLEGATEFDGRYAGAELALVSQHSGSWGWANISAGPRVNNLSLSPEDPDNDLIGTSFDLGLGTDGSLNLDSNWRAGWRLSGGIFKKTYQTRVSLSRLVQKNKNVRVGLDGGLQGDPQYSSKSAGAFVSSSLGSSIDGQLSVGLSDQEGRGAAPYIGLGLSKLF